MGFHDPLPVGSAALLNGGSIRPLTVCQALKASLYKIEHRGSAGSTLIHWPTTAASRDLLGYPLEDTAGVAFEYPVAGSAPEVLDCGHERRWLAASVTARRVLPLGVGIVWHATFPLTAGYDSVQDRKFR
jgi:hypothetical protein